MKNSIKYFRDNETCGLTGPTVLIQYAVNDGEPVLYSPWTNKVQDTMDLLETFYLNDNVLFNAAFDCFHDVKLYCLMNVIKKHLGNIVPDNLSIPQLIQFEQEALDGPCLRPKGILDLQLVAQKSKYQMCMDRKEISVNRIPAYVANILAQELNERIKFDPILFLNTADSVGKWKTRQSTNRNTGEPIHGFYDVYIKFKPSMALKTIVSHLGIVEEAKKFKDVMPERMPIELPWGPTAQTVLNVSPEQEKFVTNYLSKVNGAGALDSYKSPYRGTWPTLLYEHVKYWNENAMAREYARDDVIYTRALYEKFDKPELNDDDSVLAACVGAGRWRGFTVDLEEITKTVEELRKSAKNEMTPREQGRYIREVFSDEQRVEFDRMKNSNKIFLEKVAESGGEAGKRAKEILKKRQSKFILTVFEKILMAGRLHASFKVTGALTNRMSGGDDLNAMGINRDVKYRKLFKLKHDGDVLCGGDFGGFEVAIFEAVSNDPDLRRDLLSGKKIHALFGLKVYPEMNYDEICADKEIYTRSKSAVFAMLYGGTGPTLKKRLGVPLETAEKAYNDFMLDYKTVQAVREEVRQKFSPMVQKFANGPIEWVGYDAYVESLLGFKRYFNEIEFPTAEKLFNLACDIPEALRVYDNANHIVTRSIHKGPQTVTNACRSALYGAAFSIQSAVFRQAANHVIQSTGGGVTKKLQRLIWEEQPVGVHEWVAQPMNVHDEVLANLSQGIYEKVADKVNAFVKDMSKIIPLIEMDWKVDIADWSAK